VTLKIWDGSATLYETWITLFENVATVEDLMFVMMIYSYIVDVYSEKKREKIVSIKPYTSPIKTRKMRVVEPVLAPRTRRLRKVYNSSGSDSDDSDSEVSSDDSSESDN
jgi:hypothetical protein